MSLHVIRNDNGDHGNPAKSSPAAAAQNTSHNHQEHDMTNINSTHTTGTMYLMDPEFIEDQEINGVLTPALCRLNWIADTVATATPAEGKNMTAVQAAEIARRAVLRGELKLHGPAVIVTEPPEEERGLKPITPAPFGTDDSTSPTHAKDPCMLEHMGDLESLNLGDVGFDRYLTMETQKPDWRLDPMAFPSMITTITDTRDDEVSIISDHPEELRIMARFLTEAAAELEAAQADVSKAKAGVL